MRIDCIIWDLEDEVGGNVQHVAEHGITPEEVDEVLYEAVVVAGLLTAPPIRPQGLQAAKLGRETFGRTVVQGRETRAQPGSTSRNSRETLSQAKTCCSQTLFDR